MAKVGKSDGEATFAGRRGNDQVAPKPAIRQQASSVTERQADRWQHDRSVGYAERPYQFVQSTGLRLKQPSNTVRSGHGAIRPSRCNAPIIDL